MDRHVPDRTGGPAEAGTSGQTEGSLGKDVATAQEKLLIASLQVTLPSHHIARLQRTVHDTGKAHENNLS